MQIVTNSASSVPTTVTKMLTPRERNTRGLAKIVRKASSVGSVGNSTYPPASRICSGEARDVETTTSIGTRIDMLIVVITTAFAMVSGALGFSIQAGRCDAPKANPQIR